MAQKRKSKESFLETFTSVKLRTVVPLQKLKYTYTDGVRALSDENVTLSLQRGQEFDVAKEFGLYEDSETKKDYNLALRKLVTEGPLKGGVRAPLKPSAIYAALDAAVGSTSGAIYWKNRPLKPEVAELLAANRKLESELEESNKATEKLRQLLEKNGIKV